MAMSTITRCIPYPDGTALLADPAALRRLAEEHGVVLLRGIIERAALAEVRRQLLDLAQPWLLHDDVVRPGQSVIENGNLPQWQEWYDQVQRLRTFHALPHQPRLQAALGAILDAPVLTHPRNIARAVGPDTARFTTPPHQDFWYIGGTPDVWTAWVPVGDCPDELGGLAVLPGSHHGGVLARRPALGAGGSGVDAELSDTWAWEPLEAGDALLFHSHTVHQGRDNCTQRLRLSLDMRFQRQRDSVHHSSLEPHFGRLTWDEITRDWPTGDSLNRYWERLPLTIE